jgi:sigma-E factor negative regulatory protein RseC|uniref:Fis family transcriptional regulator n=1 Tax=candidate division WOR-3 bacterium TaxID=2052148 RepID=A0A7C6A9C4_UNCW3
MEENGKVIELTENGAKVCVTPSQVCGSCVQAKACATIGAKTKIILANNPINAQVGDWVKIELKEKSRTTSILLVFGLPILALLFGIIVGEIVAGDKMATIFGGSGLIIALIVVKIVDNHLSQKANFLPTIIEKISDPTK